MMQKECKLSIDQMAAMLAENHIQIEKEFKNDVDGFDRLVDIMDILPTDKELYKGTFTDVQKAEIVHRRKGINELYQEETPGAAPGRGTGGKRTKLDRLAIAVETGKPNAEENLREYLSEKEQKKRIQIIETHEILKRQRIKTKMAISGLSHSTYYRLKK